MTTPLAKVADWVNTELRGSEKENPLMRGMNPNAITKNESGLGQSIDSVEDMVGLLKEDEGFESHNQLYYKSDPNSTDSVEIAASYAAGGGSDYLLMQFDEDVEGYHMFGREYFVPEADWTEIESLVVSEENAEVVEEELEDVYNTPEVVSALEAPERYKARVDKPDGVGEEKEDDWYDIMYTVEASVL
ncbi:MAG: hypothetical protein ABEJ83_02280 [Candidatus Nanohaloarchaea archaeon]